MERMHTTLGQHIIPYSLVFLLAFGVATAPAGASPSTTVRS